MRRWAGRLILLLAAAAALGAVFAWPRINVVETGKTPDYPDLQPRSYRASPDKVTKAVKSTLAALPRWQLVGEGTGPAGGEIQARHATLAGLEYDVTIRIRHEAGRTQVSVRSKSRSFDWDFGQNARNIRELLAALDRAL